jgi:hypothetical protein
MSASSRRAGLRVSGQGAVFLRALAVLMIGMAIILPLLA